LKKVLTLAKAGILGDSSYAVNNKVMKTAGRSFAKAESSIRALPGLIPR
jgi:hypothetical protein